MLRSLAHADLSGKNYKIDLKKNIYIYTCTRHILRETWTAALYREGLLNVTARTLVFANHPPPSPKRAHWLAEVLSLGRILAISGLRSPLLSVLRDRWGDQWIIRVLRKF